MNQRISSVLAELGISQPTDATAAVAPSRTTFESGGRQVKVEGFVSTAAAQGPALVVLHGAGGVQYGNEHIRHVASAFAGNGISTFLVHYFDRTGHYYADDSTIVKCFETWLETIGEGISHIAGFDSVDPERIGLFGYSLGGYLAVARAARDERIRAVVELAGGIDASYAEKTIRMPPTLILHGEEDRRVLPVRAGEMKALMDKLGAPYEIQTYPGEGHMLSPRAALDAIMRGAAFLEKHLQAR